MTANNKTTAMTNSRRMTYQEIKTSSCIDYFKFRVDNIIEIPENEKDYFDFSKNGNEPGSEDYTFIHELCMILLLTPYEFYKKDNSCNYFIDISRFSYFYSAMEFLWATIRYK